MLGISFQEPNTSRRHSVAWNITLFGKRKHSSISQTNWGPPLRRGGKNSVSAPVFWTQFEKTEPAHHMSRERDLPTASPPSDRESQRSYYSLTYSRWGGERGDPWPCTPASTFNCHEKEEDQPHGSSSATFLSLPLIVDRGLDWHCAVTVIKQKGLQSKPANLTDNSVLLGHSRIPAYKLQIQR